jgi:hypothetical protein
MNFIGGSLDVYMIAGLAMRREVEALDLIFLRNAQAGQT